MSKVSIITAVTRPGLLPALYEALTLQDVAWEWLVQLDGEAISWVPQPADEKWLGDERVQLERNARPMGSGTTRNQALMRASNDLILCVDDDDLLYPKALGALCRALDKWPECFGAWGRCDVQRSTATESEVFRAWHVDGPIEPGTILRRFEDSGEFAVHVGAVLWRRGHLIAVGGYGALPRSIDTNPFLACEALFPVCYVDVPVYLYRLHGQQMTQDESYKAMQRRVHAFNFERAHQLNHLLQIRPK